MSAAGAMPAPPPALRRRVVQVQDAAAAVLVAAERQLKYRMQLPPSWSPRNGSLMPTDVSASSAPNSTLRRASTPFCISSARTAPNWFVPWRIRVCVSYESSREWSARRSSMRPLLGSDPARADRRKPYWSMQCCRCGRAGRPALRPRRPGRSALHSSVCGSLYQVVSRQIRRISGPRPLATFFRNPSSQNFIRVSPKVGLTVVSLDLVKTRHAPLWGTSKTAVPFLTSPLDHYPHPLFSGEARR